MQNCILFIRHIQQTSWKIRSRSQTSLLSGSYFMPVCHARPLGKCQMICLSLMHVSLWKPLHSSLQHPFGYASWICIGLVNVRYDNLKLWVQDCLISILIKIHNISIILPFLESIFRMQPLLKSILEIHFPIPAIPISYSLDLSRNMYVSKIEKHMHTSLLIALLS